MRTPAFCPIYLLPMCVPCATRLVLRPPHTRPAQAQASRINLYTQICATTSTVENPCTSRPGFGGVFEGWLALQVKRKCFCAVPIQVCAIRCETRCICCLFFENVYGPCGFLCVPHNCHFDFASSLRMYACILCLSVCVCV